MLATMHRGLQRGILLTSSGWENSGGIEIEQLSGEGRKSLIDRTNKQRDTSDVTTGIDIT